MTLSLKTPKTNLSLRTIKGILKRNLTRALSLKNLKTTILMRTLLRILKRTLSLKTKNRTLGKVLWLRI